MKNLTPRFALRGILVAQVVFLVGCAGGGGGGASYSSTSSSYLRSVPYSTPTRVGSIAPINSTAYMYDQSALYSQNLTGSGEHLITAGGVSTNDASNLVTYNLNVFGWSGGTLVNQTNQWFQGADNVILGTTPSVKFGNFGGSGPQGSDMFVSSYVEDGGATGSSWLFINNGTSFSRVDLNLGVNGHDSAVYDINRDGLSDIYSTGGRVVFTNADRTFTTHTVSGQNYGGTAGSVAIADFMGNGSSSVILTDQNSWQAGNNRLYSWSMTDGGRPTLDFELSLISTLPDSRLLLPKWSSYGFVGSHDYRSLAFDFDNSGLTSAIIFSRAVKSDGAGGYTWPEYNEIQFLKNRGGGVFADVTDTTLIGYNTATSASQYNPQIVDVNSDGLLDIVLGATSWTSSSGAQVLIHTKEHKYVASYGTVLDAFVGQSLALEKAINASAANGANGIVFVKGPDGNMYLATAVSYAAGGVQQKAIYLSKLGATTVSAQATAAAIKQTWPWLSDGQVNTVLAQSSTQWFGMNLLDLTQAFKPIGELQIAVAGRGLQPIRGYLAGLDMGDGQSVVTDAVGRAYFANLKSMNVSGLNSFGYNTEHIDQYNLTSHAEYLINGTPTTTNGIRVGAEGRNPFSGNGKDEGPGMLNKPTQYTVGIPEAFKYGNLSYGAQYTYLNSNPWIAFSGSWGSVNNSGILDNVITYRLGGLSAQASLMNVTTNIAPGLITKVNNMIGTWGETGYRYTQDGLGDLGLFFGVKPIILSGNVEARLPTSVDNNGNTVFTTKNLAIQNQNTGYVRALWTTNIDKNMIYRLSGIAMTNGQYRLMNEFRIFF